MHFGKVTVAQKSAYHEFLLQVEQYHEPFHAVHPIVTLFRRIHIKVDRFTLCHNYEAVKVLLGRIFEIVLFQSAILDVKNASLLCRSIVLLYYAMVSGIFIVL